MLKKIVDIWNSHAIYILPGAGFTFLIVGQTLISLEFYERFATILSNTGIALLGGSLFTAITKTSHYTKFFQDRIYDVFYSPEKSVVTEVIKNKWTTLTHFMLHRTAGDLHEDVAKELLKRYFDSDIPYYFSEITETYDLVLSEDDRTLSIKKKFTCRVIINESRDEAILVQKSTSKKVHELKAIYVDHKDAMNDIEIIEKEIDKNGGKEKYLEISIKLINKGKPIVVERYFEKEQDINDEPWTIVNNSKFIQQLIVKYKAINCKVKVISTGSIAPPEKEINKYEDQDGYTRVILSPPGGLTLPGEGYILLVQASKGGFDDEP